MCKNCKSSELGQSRQSELDAAEAACKSMNLHPDTAGFIARYKYRRIIPASQQAGNIRFTEEERATLDRYNAAWKAMKDLHEDYVWSLVRQSVEERCQHIASLDPREIDAIAAQLHEHIKRDDFGANGRLPTVTELAKEYQGEGYAQ